MATKTFNIGEYAIGGRIKVDISNNAIAIKALDWNTKSIVMESGFDKINDWQGSYYSGRQIDNFLNDLTSSYYADKIMDWIKSNVEVKYAQGGNIDRDIKAKPIGYRFKGEDNYKRPLVSERGRSDVYYEDRKNRSDKNLRKKLEEGGETENLKLSKLLKDLENAEGNVNDWERTLSRESRGDYEPGDLPSRSDIKDYIRSAKFEVDRIQMEIDEIKSTGSMARGGEVKDENYDLFNDWDKLPKNVQEILSDYDEDEGVTYADTQKMLRKLKPLGYTFDYGMDGVGYNLRKIKSSGGSLATGGKMEDYRITYFEPNDQEMSERKYNCQYKNKDEAISVAKHFYNESILNENPYPVVEILDHFNNIVYRINEFGESSGGSMADGGGERMYLVKAIVTDEDDKEIPIEVNIWAKSENSAMDKAEANIREQNPKWEDFSIDIESVKKMAHGGRTGEGSVWNMLNKEVSFWDLFK